jgi:hypothetical protein
MDSKDKVQKEPSTREKEDAVCPKCKSLWPKGSDTCAHCGLVRQKRNIVDTVAGSMEELTLTKSPKEKYDSETKERWFQELLGYAKDKGYSSGWAFHKYIEKFGIQPAWKKIAATPSKEVSDYILSRNIAFFNSKNK